MANRCVRDSARVFNPNPRHVPQDARQASDLLDAVGAVKAALNKATHVAEE